MTTCEPRCASHCLWKLKIPVGADRINAASSRRIFLIPKIYVQAANNGTRRELSINKTLVLNFVKKKIVNI